MAARALFAAIWLLAFASAAAEPEKPSDPSSPATGDPPRPTPEGGAPAAGEAAAGPATAAPAPSTATDPSPGNAPAPAIPVKVPSAAERMQRITAAARVLYLTAAGLEYEGAFNDKLSLYLGGFFPFAGLPSAERALEFYGGLRFFPLPNAVAPKGFWAGVGGLFSFSSALPALWLDAMAGYTFIADGGFTTSLGAGGRAAMSSDALSSFVIGGGIQLNLGYAF